jgi:hypothetical protein
VHDLAAGEVPDALVAEADAEQRLRTTVGSSPFASASSWKRL